MKRILCFLVFLFVLLAIPMSYSKPVCADSEEITQPPIIGHVVLNGPQLPDDEI